MSDASTAQIRRLVGDTETTGIPEEGKLNEHRLIEVALIELVGFKPTGREFHVQINPERDIDPEATKIHGKKYADLKGKPRFREIAREFVQLMTPAYEGEPVEFVAHNASFDWRFVTDELNRARIALPDVKVVDTLQIARKKFPGSPASLDALVKRFGIDPGGRATQGVHGAMIDSRLLVQVYLHLMDADKLDLAVAADTGIRRPVRADRETWFPRRASAPLLESEIETHAAAMAGIKDNLWGQYLSPPTDGEVQPQAI